MEGFLKVFVKRTFSLSTFEQYWVVLDGQNLTFYQGIDVQAETVGPFKDVVILKGSKVNKLRPKENGTAYGLKILSESGSQLALMDCDDQSTCSRWFRALNRAATLHVDLEEKQNNLEKFCRTLTIDPSKVTLSKELITRTYKRMALQHHPDKGGDVKVFNDINIAYNGLLSIQAAEDDKKSTYPVDYEVVIRKGGDGVGLGIVVLEDKVRHHIIVQSVQDNIQIEGMTAEAGGVILPGDILVGIGKDDCSHWFISRVKARLNGFRVPVNTTVRLAFERRLPKSSQSDTYSEPAYTPQTNSSAFSKSPQREHKTEYESADIDEDFGPEPDQKAADVSANNTFTAQRAEEYASSGNQRDKYAEEADDFSDRRDSGQENRTEQRSSSSKAHSRPHSHPQHHHQQQPHYASATKSSAAMGTTPSSSKGHERDERSTKKIAPVRLSEQFEDTTADTHINDPEFYR
jgi:hypothetical protein